MLQQVLSQLAIYSTNTVNINLIERGDNGANVSTAELVKITKLVSRFFERMENHILEGIHPDTVPAFTPKDSNPNHKVPSVIVSATNAKERSTAEKTKSDASSPGTPACDRHSKKQKLKAGAGSKDFTKAGLLRCKEGTPVGDLLPSDLSKKYCSFFCFHDKKCSKLKQSCDFEHVGKWDKIPVEDQTKILEHCHASGGKIWLNADTFAKHRVTDIPKKLAYLLGDVKGPTSAYTQLRAPHAWTTEWFTTILIPLSFHCIFQTSYDLSSYIIYSYLRHIRPTMQLRPLGLPLNTR